MDDDRYSVEWATLSHGAHPPILTAHDSEKSAREYAAGLNVSVIQIRVPRVTV